jgi:hypothetical protein
MTARTVPDGRVPRKVHPARSTLGAGFRCHGERRRGFEWEYLILVERMRAVALLSAKGSDLPPHPTIAPTARGASTGTGHALGHRSLVRDPSNHKIAVGPCLDRAQKTCAGRTCPDQCNPSAGPSAPHVPVSQTQSHPRQTKCGGATKGNAVFPAALPEPQRPAPQILCHDPLCGASLPIWAVSQP